MNSEVPDRSGLRGPSHLACIGIGSNSEPASNLAAALQALGHSLAIEAVSTAWESPAVGVGVDVPDYVNAALLVRTALAKDQLIGLLKRTEVALGRTRDTGISAAVAIDIDLLVFEGRVQTPGLWDLAYRAVPAAELLPELARPGSAERLAAVAEWLAEKVPIRPRPDILRAASWPRAGSGAPDLRLPIP